MEVEKIMVLVKLTDGTVRQVFTTDAQKELGLQMMIGENGLKVGPPLKDITIVDREHDRQSTSTGD